MQIPFLRLCTRIWSNCVRRQTTANVDDDGDDDGIRAVIVICDYDNCFSLFVQLQIVFGLYPIHSVRRRHIRFY